MECRALVGKPKIFLFQYCRGDRPDPGVPRPVCHDRSLDAGPAGQTLTEAVVKRDPTFTDMFIVYSTVGGFASVRHPERGTWLMEALCSVFWKHAREVELEQLMKMVDRRVSENEEDDGSKQVCEIVQRGFNKYFYFC